MRVCNKHSGVCSEADWVWSCPGVQATLQKEARVGVAWRCWLLVLVRDARRRSCVLVLACWLAVQLAAGVWLSGPLVSGAAVVEWCWSTLLMRRFFD